MSETGSPPSSTGGSGDGGSGGGAGGDPGKTDAVHDIARNEAIFANLNTDVVTVICEFLDEPSRLKLRQINKESKKSDQLTNAFDRAKITDTRTAEARAESEVSRKLGLGQGYADSEDTTRQRFRNISATHSSGGDIALVSSFSNMANDYLMSVSDSGELIKFANSLVLAAKGAYRLDAFYKISFEGLLDKTLYHVASLHDPRITTADEMQKLGKVRAELVVMLQKARDARLGAGQGSP